MLVNSRLGLLYIPKLFLDNYLVWTLENFFTDNGRACHELSFFYAVSLAANGSLLAASSLKPGSEGEQFQWFSREIIQTLDLRPRFLKSKLQTTAEGFKHIIFREGVSHFLDFAMPLYKSQST